jgi:hypothetical protein
MNFINASLGPAMTALCVTPTRSVQTADIPLTVFKDAFEPKRIDIRRELLAPFAEHLGHLSAGVLLHFVRPR